MGVWRGRKEKIAGIIKKFHPPGPFPSSSGLLCVGMGWEGLKHRVLATAFTKCPVLGEAHGFGAAEIIRVVLNLLYFPHVKEPLSALKQPLTCTRPSVKGQQRFEQDAVGGEGVQRGGGGALLFATHWPD